MLNRRILRIKAMQALYAHELAIASMKQILSEQVSQPFDYDPAFHDMTEKVSYEKKSRFVRNTFLSKVDDPDMSLSDLDPEIIEAIRTGIEEYQQGLIAEKSAGRKRMEEEIANIHKTYLKLLLLPGEVAFIERKEKDRQEKKASSKWTRTYNFMRNPFVDALTTYKPLVDLAMKEKVDWNGEAEELRGWYKNIWSKNDEIISYQSKDDPTEEEHYEAAKYLMKNLVFKTDEVDEFMSAKDLHWSENKSILKSMVTKTIQSYAPDLDEAFELKALSLNEKDDFAYFRLLFDETIGRGQELESIIAKKTKNWDMSRVATLDKIILKMALSEMFNFPSIPVKVTINEFIEISKKYSTPKSKQFVNGILDVLANELTSEGLIKKSGRGLIDNK